MAERKPVTSGEGVGGRIPLPWARSGYDLSEPGARRNLKPGPNGSRCHTGGSIVLGCGHTWGYPAYFDSGDQPGGAEPRTRRTERLEGAQRVRTWASAEAQESGLSVRQLASATGLSSSRGPTPGLERGPRDPPVATVSSAGRTDPTNHAPEAAPSRGLPDLQTRLAGEMDPAPVPRVAGASGPRGAGRGEPAARDRS